MKRYVVHWAVIVLIMQSALLFNAYGMGEADVTRKTAGTTHTLTFVDAANVPLKDLEVSFSVGSNGPILFQGYTDANGTVKFGLDNGTYHLTARWLGLEVYSGDLNLTAPDPITLKLQIYTMKLKAVDALNSALEGAVVQVKYNARVLYNVVTDSNGITPVRLPKDHYHISVTWSGVKVFDDDVFLSGEVVAITSEVYAVEVTAHDSRGTGLGGAGVYFYQVSRSGALLTSASVRTDSKGHTDTRLPIGDYVVRIFWNGDLVYNSTLSVEADTTLNATCAVYYLTVRVMDRDGNVLTPAYVTVFTQNMDIVSGSKTDPNGMIVFRLPKGKYRVEAYYRGEYMFTEVSLEGGAEVDLNNSSQVDINFRSYPYRFYATNAFVVAVGFILLLLLLALAFYHLRRRSNGGRSESGSERPKRTKT